MRFLSGALGTEQVAFTYRRMPAGTGSKGGYGHRHRTQEEIYFVVDGTLQFKLDDEIVDVGPLTAVRIAPSTVRGVWNEGPDDAHLVICSTRVEDLRAEGEIVEDFWPAD
ncbi:MAG TPA: cupin domain-containing protein [Solirubrobacteraceae bacterium]|nr:cupin domain-containing protein [Solirubrobacteraceae bacterium]